MYTIRQILGTTLGLQMSGVKWEKSSENPATPQPQVKTVHEYTELLQKKSKDLKASNPEKSAKLLEVAQKIEQSSNTLGRSLSRLHQSIPKPISYEDAEQKAIQAFTAVGIQQGKAEDYAEIFVDAIKTTQMDLSNLKMSVEHSDGLSYEEMKDVILDPSNFSQETNRERFLSIFRGMKKTAVRTSNFGAQQFDTAFSLYAKDTNTLQKSISDVTRKEFGSNEAQNKALAQEYIQKVNLRADFLSRMYSLYNGQPQMGGLEAVMTGNDKKMLEELFARPDFAEKMQANGMSEESLWQYIKNTGITLPIPSMNFIGSYSELNDEKRNAEGLRTNNARKGEKLYIESNVFGLVDQISGKEPASVGKVAADVVRTLIRPVEVGISLDDRSRMIENSALVSALAWNAVFDMKSGTVNTGWEKNVDAIISEFQKGNILPKEFNKESLMVSMKGNIEYFESISQNDDSKNVLILSGLRRAYVDQAAQLVAARIDQGTKIDGVSAGIALLVLPFVKLNTSTIAMNRVAVDSKTNDVAHTSARILADKNIDVLKALGITYAKKDKNHEYTIGDKPADGVDFSKLQLPEGVKLTDDKKTLISDTPLTIQRTRTIGVDVSQGDTGYTLTVEKAKQETKKTNTTKNTEDSSKILDDERKLEKPLGGSIYEMTRIRSTDSEGIKKTKQEFTKAMELIGNQKYSEALTALEVLSKKSQVAKNIISTLGGSDKITGNPESLAVVLSYTYGAINREKQGEATKKDYEIARKGTTEAEKRLAPTRWNQENENAFAQVEKHTPKSLSDVYGKDRAISVSVFATPKGGTHRIDKIDGSIKVSDTVKELNTAQKDAVIAEHGKAIDAALDRVNKILPKESPMTKSEYVEILKTGNIPEKFGSLKIEKPTVFFEARAMIQGNFCANKVEGMVLPTFSYNTKKEETVYVPEYADNTVFNGDRASVDGKAFGAGIMKGFSSSSKAGEKPKDPNGSTVLDGGGGKGGTGIGGTGNGSGGIGR